MDIARLPVGMPQGFYVYEGTTYRNGVELPGLWMPFAEPQRNLVMYDYATVVSQLLAGNPEYKASVMYFEFRNLDNPDDPITAPSYGRADGIDYYMGLSESEDTDYIRASLTATTVSIQSGESETFPGGNVLTAFAQTSGALGVNGKTFSDSVNSKVFGGALVSSPDPEDSSRDLIISRFYFSAEKQQVKLASSQIGLAWPLTQQ